MRLIDKAYRLRLTISVRKIYSPTSRSQEGSEAPSGRESGSIAGRDELSALTRPSGSNVTLRDVAENSGVSITTVSRILNGRESGVPIRDETRQRVLAVAAELGYRPNLLARGLRGCAARCSASSPATSPIRSTSRSCGASTRPSGERELPDVPGARRLPARPRPAYGSMFEQTHADGIILIGDLEGGDAALDVLSRQHRYVVGVTDRIGRRQVPGVYGDSVAGTQIAMDHLWELGHRAIVCVSDAVTDDGRLRLGLYERVHARPRRREHHPQRDH